MKAHAASSRDAAHREHVKLMGYLHRLPARHAETLVQQRAGEALSLEHSDRVILNKSATVSCEVDVVWGWRLGQERYALLSVPSLGRVVS